MWVPTLMTFLKDSRDPSNQAAALSTLTSFHSKLPYATANEVRTISLSLLASPDFGLKASAVQVLAADGSKQSLEALKYAAQTETNPGRRDFINRSVQAGSSPR